jgi:hypothetical protein
MKFFRILLFFILLSFAQAGYGQAIVAVSNKYTPEITEQYHVFKDKDTVRQGLYQAFYKKHTIIASGAYNKGKRSGIWHFFDINGKLTQHYDYDKKQFAYIGPEDSTADVIKYVFLPKPADTTW